ncbi:response regulator [Pedobacter sp. SYP-B3415]|uniref:response regulator n=1 Tax=Pedobacter sp. SYP-B3415 TaxID=2496641 RepID=UPI00101E03B1|nr:response regulator [Pedobacter sp. SYP-B3415]
MENKASSQKRVMLIDDNDIDLKINSKIITLSGLFQHITMCRSGEEAITYLQRNIDMPGALPDFILLDIQMPEMDGFEFLEYYKKLDEKFINKCVLAILSSTLDYGDIKRAEANPYVSRLIKKPLYLNELKEICSHYLLSN